MIILVTVIFLTELTEVFYSPLLQLLPRRLFVLSHVFLLIVFIQYMRVYLKYKLIEEALRESEEKFKGVFNSSHDGILVADAETRKFNSSNDRICGMLGYSHEEFQNLGIDDIHPEEDMPYIVEQFRRLINEEITLVKEVRVKRKDGSIFFADIGASNVQLRGKIYSVGMFRDITERKRMEEILKKRQIEQKAILSNIPDIAWLKDNESRFIAVNEPFGNSCGMRPDDLVGKTDLDIWPQNLADQYRADDREVMENRKRKIVEEPLIDKDGKKIWIETIKTPIFNDGGAVIGTTGIARDITARKKMEETLRKYEYIVSSSNEHMSLINRDYIYQSVNNAYLKAHGKSRDEIVGHSVVDLLSAEIFEERVKENFDRCLRGETVNYQSWFDFPGSGRRYMDVYYYPFYEHADTVSGVVVVSRDITEHRHMEEQINEYSRGLENMVKERTAKLEEKTVQAEAATRTKSEFLSNMSHELRTPLNAIIGFSEILKGGTVGDLTDEQNDYLKDIWQSGKHLNRIINDILNMMETEPGKGDLELSEFPLKEMIEEAFSRFSGKAERQGIKLSEDIPDALGHLIADRKKVLQVLQNLLGNALKFTHEGGSIRVAARRVGSQALRVRSNEVPGLLTLNFELDRDFIEISVADTGIGIAKEDIARLFQPFQQLSTALTKEYEGVGLGLSICRKNIELHKGKIWVESEAGKGSKFLFVIPAR